MLVGSMDQRLAAKQRLLPAFMVLGGQVWRNDPDSLPELRDCA